MRSIWTSVLSILAAFSITNPAAAINGKIFGTQSGFQVLSQATKENTAVSLASVKSDGRFTLNSTKTATLFIAKKGRPFGPVVMGIKYGTSYYSLTAAKAQGICKKSSARAIMGLNLARVTQRLDIKADASNKFGYLMSLPDSSQLALSLAKIDGACIPKGAKGKLGIPRAADRIATAATYNAAATDTDRDGVVDSKDNDIDNDGVPNIVDADNNNDGKLDNDDSISNDIVNGGTEENKFWMFSNYHLDAVDAINLNALPTLDDATLKQMVDDRLQRVSSLAIQVVGNGDFHVELDCGNLQYCKAGGTGGITRDAVNDSGESYQEFVSFPGTAGDSAGFDLDGDGKGLITPGNTGDFQLKTKATSDTIHAGDILIQEVIKDGKLSRYAGMLNFVFFTSPAVKTVSVQGGQTYTVNYPMIAGDPGTPTNCFKVPASGDVIVTLTAWRPQRQGITKAGEAKYMDMGNLRLQTNIPNGPWNTEGEITPTTGPGVCIGNSSNYPAIDAAFSLRDDGLQDNLGDKAQDVSNTFTYTINYTECLKAANNANKLDITWNAGQYLMVPIQMTNQYGDTATQNVCFEREAL